MKRQALYACNTCTPKGGEPSGVCLACSYKCHEGHDLFELYTKRSTLGFKFIIKSQQCCMQTPPHKSHTHTCVDSGYTLTVYQVNSEGSDHV